MPPPSPTGEGLFALLAHEQRETSCAVYRRAKTARPSAFQRKQESFR